MAAQGEATRKRASGDEMGGASSRHKYLGVWGRAAALTGMAPV